MEKQAMHEKLEAQEKRNRELRAKINELDATLEDKRLAEKTSKRELYEVQQQFQNIRQSLPFRMYWKMRKGFGKSRKGKHYIRKGKRYIRKVRPSSHQRKKAKKQVNAWKYKLQLGFTTKALEEMKEAYHTSKNMYMKRFAAWEIALWHFNEGTPKDARKGLTYLEEARKKENNHPFLRQIAILEAEAYDLLQAPEKAMQVLESFLEKDVHPDILLAAANLAPSTEARVQRINQALRQTDITPVTIEMNKSNILYDCLDSDSIGESDIKTDEQPKVTIIVPVYNGETEIETALNSLRKQSWTNLEIIVVDDCSTDNTVQVVNKYVEKDERINLLTTGTNSGPYIARNIALEQAAGDFITVNDADDWSHPDKIYHQAVHLIRNENVIANTTEQVRMNEDLTFYRRGQPGRYIFPNMSSLMFRRKPVAEILGYWDAVRFGADGEMKRRMIYAFGEDSVVDLQTGPYSFTRQTSESLTGTKAFGYHGFLVGARKEYLQSHEHFHEDRVSLYYPHPMKERLFPVPEPMWPEREEKQGGTRHFDVIIASEFRLPGGTNMSNIEEIKAQQKMGLKTGLIQINRYDFTSRKVVNPAVRELIHGDDVQMIVYGEKVSCDVLIMRHPPILQDWQDYLPEIDAKNVCVIINQTPRRDYGENGDKLFDIQRCAEHVKQYTGKAGTWYPIGPLIRKTLLEHHPNELEFIHLVQTDWVNIIDVEEWRRFERPKYDAIRIGRHSRDHYVKWPASAETLLAAYPDKSPFEVHVLGGASVPEKVLGKLPKNWRVHPFGKIAPRDFLRELDVFVYYTHPDWVESFGRVIFEAMAVGVPVIIPPSYKELFGNAAIYAESDDVQHEIEKLMQDRERYDTCVKNAWAYVEKYFGHATHASRLRHRLIKETVNDG